MGAFRAAWLVFWWLAERRGPIRITEPAYHHHVLTITRGE